MSSKPIKKYSILYIIFREKLEPSQQMVSYSAPKSKAKRLIKQYCPRETQNISKPSQSGNRVIIKQITADSTHGKAFVPVNQNPNFFKVLTSAPLDFVKSDPGKGHKTTLLFSFRGDL